MYRNKYEELIAIRLHTNEKLELMSRAKSHDISLSDYVRQELKIGNVKE